MVLKGEPIAPCAHLDSACAHPDSVCSECDSECALRMDGGGVPHPPFATLAGRSAAPANPHQDQVPSCHRRCHRRCT
eukprot:6951904-Prymnesium_polylepis.1